MANSTEPPSGSPVDLDHGDVRWLDTAEQRAWRSYLGGSIALAERVDRDLRERHGLSEAEYEVLVRLSEAPDRRMRMAQLAAAVSHSRSRSTHLVSRLVKAGLVERDTCTDDGRGVLAVLTDKGFELLATAAHTHVRGVRGYFFDAMEPGDAEVVGRLFETVRLRLDGTRF